MTRSISITTDPETWRAALVEIGGYDFHHTYDFHAISQSEGEGDPLLVLGTEDGKPAFAMPLLSRSIPNTSHRDLTSAYGYPGPVYKVPEDAEAWLDDAFKALADQSFVSVFGRLHPVHNHALIEAEPSFVRRLGEVIAADLSRPENELKKEIRGLKNGTIKKIEKTGVTLRESRDPSDVPDFQRIYRATMDRLDASPYYYFSDAYISALLAAEDFAARLVFADLDGQPIGATIMIETASFQQYYLSGTDPEHFRLSPVSLLLAREIFAAKERHHSHFILGGGYGGADSGLAKFKLGFSKTTLPAGLLCKVLDAAAYNALSAGSQDTGFFPLYRQPA